MRIYQQIALAIMIFFASVLATSAQELRERGQDRILDGMYEVYEVGSAMPVQLVVYVPMGADFTEYAVKLLKKKKGSLIRNATDRCQKYGCEELQIVVNVVDTEFQSYIACFRSPGDKVRVTRLTIDLPKVDLILLNSATKRT
jgi:hypothetical protein